MIGQFHTATKQKHTTDLSKLESKSIYQNVHTFEASLLILTKKIEYKSRFFETQ